MNEPPTHDPKKHKQRLAGQKAVATKGPDELSRAGKKAAWTRKHGKDDARNPHTKPTDSGK